VTATTLPSTPLTRDQARLRSSASKYRAERSEPMTPGAILFIT
jgi:hypothetical protein